MVTKVHGTSFPGEHLTGNMDFFTVDTLVDIRPSAEGNPAATSQIALDRLVEVISTRAQPILLGGIVVNTGANPGNVPAYVSGNTYTVKFAVEHANAVDVVELQETLNGIAGFVYAGDESDNIVVTRAVVL
jgi:hypothetical protein